MILFYGCFAGLWTVAALIHFYFIKDNEPMVGRNIIILIRNSTIFYLQEKARFEFIALLLPSCMAAYSLLNMAVWLNYELTGILKSVAKWIKSYLRPFQMTKYLIRNISIFRLHFTSFTLHPVAGDTGFENFVLLVNFVFSQGIF